MVNIFFQGAKCAFGSNLDIKNDVLLNTKRYLKDLIFSRFGSVSYITGLPMVLGVEWLEHYLSGHENCVRIPSWAICQKGDFLTLSARGDYPSVPQL